MVYTKGKFYFVGWDYNLSMGNFMDGMSSANSDVRTSLSSNDLLQYRPLCKIVQSSEYSAEYLKYVRQIRSLFSNPEQYVKSIADKIGSHVQADPNNLSDYNGFLSNTSRGNAGGGQQQDPWGGGQQNPWGGGGWGGGFGGGFGGGGGGGMFGGGNVSVVDFLITRFDVINSQIGN